MPRMGDNFPIDGVVTVAGGAAHDAPETGFPIQIAGSVDETSPATPAEGDVRRVRVSPEGNLYVENRIANNTSVAIRASGDDGRSNADFTFATNPYTNHFNGITWDRWRGNTEAEILASAARTATVNSADFINYNAKGVIITLDVTATADTPSITLQIEHKDSSGSKYEILLLTTAAVTATGVHTYIVYPGIGAASDDVVQVAGFPLGRTWRVTVTHADGDSITYSVAASYIL